MKPKRKLIGLQVIFVVAFLLQPILLPVRPDDIDKHILSRELVKNIVANLLIVLFFYFNYFVLIPKLYFTKKYTAYFLTVLLFLVAVLFLSALFSSGFSQSRMQPFQESLPFEQAIPNRPPPPFGSIQNPNLHDSLISKIRFYFTENDQTFFLFGAIVLFSLLLRINNRYYKTENAKQEAEINYLLAQINPHFLFNVLNSIYTLTIKENATNSSTSILKLSGLLRYVFTETNNNRVSLEKEITCINDFIDLQKLRLNNNVQLQYIVNGSLEQKLIAPILLMPFIENAFKHGVSTDEISSIFIQIDVENNHLKMVVRNNKVAINNDTIGKSGLGIENSKNRLNLLYPNKHELHIVDKDTFYEVTLLIEF